MIRTQYVLRTVRRDSDMEACLDTKNLKYFVGVARYGSINQAAKAMYISQPQLSHIIKSIEEEVGFDLFQRTNQGVRLTRNGESFLSHCQIILEEMNSLDRFINQTHRQGSRLVVSMTRFSHTAVCFNDVACRHQDRESLFLRLRETDSMDVVPAATPKSVSCISPSPRARACSAILRTSGFAFRA